MSEQPTLPRRIARAWIAGLLLGVGALSILGVYGYRKWEDATDRSV